MKLFIDIDRCLIGKRHPRDIETYLANGALEFLAFALEQFDYSGSRHTVCRGNSSPSWST